MADSCRSLVDFWPNLADIGEILAKFTRLRADSGQNWSNSAPARTQSARRLDQIGRARPNLCRCRPKLDLFWPTFGLISAEKANSGAISGSFGQMLPIAAEFGPHLADIGPSSPEVLAHFGQLGKIYRRRWRARRKWWSRGASTKSSLVLVSYPVETHQLRPRIRHK